MRMFKLNRKNANLFGRCDVNYQVGYTGDFTGTPTVLWDRIVFNKAGYTVIGTTAESYRKTLYLKPNTTYTLSFTLSGYTSAYILLQSDDLDLWYSVVATSPITFTTKELSVTNIALINNMSNTGGLTISNLMLNEGSSALPYVSPIEDEVTINDELFGYAGIWDTWDSSGHLVKRWKRETKTTDASGNFTLTGYQAGPVICVNNTTGEVTVLTAAATVATNWANASVTVIYLAAAPTILENVYSGSIDLVSGDNTLTVPQNGSMRVVGNMVYLQG